MKICNVFWKVALAGIFTLYTVIGMAQTPITSVQQKIAEWQTSAGLVHASIGIAVSDLVTGEELIKSEPQLSLVPASILKVVTTATALEVFGPDFRFTTTFCGSGSIKNDTLFGDLQIIGGGDPTLGSGYFHENNHFLDDWIKTIQSKNIRVISGNLVMDASIYESQMIPNSWVWEDLGNYYGAGASGISVYDNLYEIHLSSEKEEGKLTKIERIYPEIPGLEIRNEVVSSFLNSDQAYVFGSLMDNKRIINGTIPVNKSDFVVKASVPNPAVLLVSEFKRKLAANGIRLSGETKFEKAKISQPTPAFISINQSPALREIIKVTNHESVNLFAEHLLKHLAFQKYGLGTTIGGCKFIMEFWKEKGLDMMGFFMNDGSGLSRFDAITASQMVAILNYMKAKSTYSADFFESLAKVGNGTLTVLNNDNFPKDCLHAKSGSMTRVRCYAGYLTTISGRQLSFTIMLNNFSCSQTEAIQEIQELLIVMRKL